MARIARGLDQELSLGSLESRRDWGRAQDYVAAIWLMLQQEKPGDYVVASGETHSVRDFVEAAFAIVNLSPEKYVKRNPAFVRPADPARLVGSPEKAKRELGWEPRGSFNDLVREMVEAELAAIDAQPDSDQQP